MILLYALAAVLLELGEGCLEVDVADDAEVASHLLHSVTGCDVHVELALVVEGPSAAGGLAGDFSGAVLAVLFEGGVA